MQENRNALTTAGDAVENDGLSADAALMAIVEALENAGYPCVMVNPSGSDVTPTPAG